MTTRKKRPASRHRKKATTRATSDKLTKSSRHAAVRKTPAKRTTSGPAKRTPRIKPAVTKVRATRLRNAVVAALENPTLTRLIRLLDTWPYARPNSATTIVVRAVPSLTVLAARLNNTWRFPPNNGYVGADISSLWQAQDLAADIDLRKGVS